MVGMGGGSCPGPCRCCQVCLPLHMAYEQFSAKSKREITSVFVFCLFTLALFSSQKKKAAAGRGWDKEVKLAKHLAEDKQKSKKMLELEQGLGRI